MIASIEVSSVEPLAGGASFGECGSYLMIRGTAKGEIDPDDRANRVIAALEFAPRNARGRVEYQADICILRPADADKGNHRLLYEVTNRGNKLLFTNLSGATVRDNLLQKPGALGNALPLRRGFTIVWSGWDADAPRADGGMSMSAPVAVANGEPVVRTIRDEFVSGTRRGALDKFSLSYEAASLDPEQARLSVRLRRTDARRDIRRTHWEFVDSRSIRLLPPETVAPGALYDFYYSAKNAKVLGLGFAATRDLISFLRRDMVGEALLQHRVTHALAVGFSQGGRYLREHIALGFNRDERGERVFDGVLTHTAGIGRLFYNELFAQPFRTRTIHQDHDFPENTFPFATALQKDPVTGASGALLRGDGSDPLLIQSNTSSEYWQKGASLLHTDSLATTDVAEPETSRLFMIAGTQHDGKPGLKPERGPCVNLTNPHDPSPVLRALLIALDDWVVRGIVPPASRHPMLADGSLCEADAIGFPQVPGAAVARALNPVGPPVDWVTPKPALQSYRPLVCRVDSDGNEIAGVLTPDIAVPLGTYAAWNLYRPTYPHWDMADRNGTFIPFCRTDSDCKGAGDPRPSIEARYADTATYVARVRAAAEALVSARLLLAEDVDLYADRASADFEKALADGIHAG